MKKLIFILLTIATAACNNDIEITFRVKSTLPDKTDSIFITGNNEKLGNWDPGKVSLLKNGEFWERTISFEKEDSILFKFTRGGWETEAVKDNGDIPQNYSLRFSKDTVFETKINHWKDEFEYEIKGQITGEVKYHREMKYDFLKKRDVILWLPPGYEDDKTEKYPVLYMHDGQNIIDPKTASINTDWQIDEVADSLIRANIIEPVIIVGIYNTSDRMHEYISGDTSAVYMKFIVDYLKPFIDKKYRTRPGRESTFTGGSSAGGMIAFQLAWEYPEVFGGAACFSPAFKIDYIDYVTPVKEYKGKKPDIKIYIDNGGKGLETQLRPGIDEMIETLQNKGFREGKDLEIYFDKSAEHTESEWAKRIHKPLKFFFGEK